MKMLYIYIDSFESMDICMPHKHKIQEILSIIWNIIDSEFKIKSSKKHPGGLVLSGIRGYFFISRPNEA